MRKRFVGAIPSLHHEHASYKWWVMFNVMLGTFMVVINATTVNVALPKMMASLGITISTAQWISTAYMLALAVMLPTSGWLADHLGFKRTYFSALFLFTLGSFLCGLSGGFGALITCRVIQGLGAGLLQPVGLAIITREFPKEQRGLAMGFWGIAAAASVSLGPMLGGYIIDRFDWDMIFNCNVPVGLFSLFATWIIQREYRSQEGRDFDWIGFASLVVFLSALLVGLASGNAEWNTGGWTSDFILACLVISIAGFTVFLVAEFSVRHPLVNLRLLGRFTFGLTNGILFIFGLGMFGSTFLLPLFLQNSLGYTALQAGLFFLPMGLLQALISPVAGILADKFNPKVPIITGIMFMAASFFLNSRLSLFSEHQQIIGSLYVRGLGMGMLFTPLGALALSDIPRKEMAQASGLFNVIRQIGGSFGVAAFSTLLVQRVSFHTAVYGEALNRYSPAFKSIENNLTYFIQNTTGGTLADAVQRSGFLIRSHAMVQAFVQAVDDDFLVAAIATASCIFLILILPTPKRGIPK